MGTNQQEGLNDALNFLDAFYWKIRFALDKIKWDKIESIPTHIRQLFNPKVQPVEKSNVTKRIGETVAPIFAWVGTVSIGIFVPLKAALKVFDDKENKVVNFLAYVGKAAINVPYFFKFSLPMLFFPNEKELFRK